MKPKKTAFVSAVMAAATLRLRTPFQAHAVDSFDAVTNPLTLGIVHAKPV